MNSLEQLSTNGSISRDYVNHAENLMRQMPQVELKVRHFFSEGVYARELTIPAGIVLTGHIHKYSNLNIISKGKLQVLVDGEIKIIEAPSIIVSPPGTKRIAYALEETVWTTIHGTFSTDLNEIERHFIAHNEQEYLEFCRQSDTQLILPLKGDD